MLYKKFKDKKLSRLGMGNMRLPVAGDKQGAPVDHERAQEIIDFAMTNGVNYFDTAYVYHNGESEKFLGEALAKYPRDSYYLATKFFILAGDDYKAVFEEQLSRLKTDYIDFYLIHAIFDHTYQRYLDCGCIEYLLEQKEKGRIKHLGFSSHANLENFTTFTNHHQWDFSMIVLNPYDWLFGTCKQEYEILAERKIPVIAMEPIRGGRLISLSSEAEKILKDARPNWSMAEWLLRWGKSRSESTVVLSGMSTINQIKENVPFFSDDAGLNAEEELLLYKALEAFKSEMQVPCTDCRYCVEDDTCPLNINIPKFLEVYNTYKVDGPWALSGLDNVETVGQPTDCTACGKCSERCPQSIDIQGIMGELSELIKNRA